MRSFIFLMIFFLLFSFLRADFLCQKNLTEGEVPLTNFLQNAAWRRYEVESLLTEPFPRPPQPDSQNNNWEISPGSVLNVNSSGEVLIGNALEDLPVVELKIGPLSAEEYIIKASVYIPPGVNGDKISYLYGYHERANFQRYILAGDFVSRKKNRFYEFFMTPVKTVNGEVKIYLGPVVYRGSGGGRRSNYGWLVLEKRNVFGAWDYLELLPTSSVPAKEKLDGGKYRVVEKKFSKTLNSATNFTLAVNGNFPPVMKTIEIECLTGKVVYPKILIEGNVDFSTLQTIVDSIITPGMNEEEKAMALFDFIVGPFFYHTTRVVEKGRSFYNPPKSITVYGFGWCSVHASIYYALATKAGLEVQVTESGHKFNRVKWNGKWHCVDCDLGVVIRDENREIISFEEMMTAKIGLLKKHGDEFGYSPTGATPRWYPAWVRYPEVHHTRRTIGFHPLQADLREGEKFIRFWGGESYNVNLYYPPRRNHHPRDGKGVFDWRFKAKSDFTQELQEVNNLIYQNGKIKVRNTSQEASLVIPVKSPYVIRGGEIEVKGQWESLEVLIKERRDDEWTLIKTDLENETKLPLPTPPDSYQYQVKLNWPAGQSGEVNLTEFRLLTEFQYYFYTLPQLKLGENNISYQNLSQEGEVKVEIVYLEKYKNPVKEEAKDYGWGEQKIIVGGGDRFCCLPALAVAENKVCLVYQQGKLWAPSSLWYIIKDGDNFSPPQRLTPDGIFAWHPEVAADSRGNFHFVFQGSEDGEQSDIYYCFLNSSTGQISSIEKINPDDYHYAFQPYLTISPRDEMTVTWEAARNPTSENQKYENPRVWLRKKKIGAEWEAPKPYKGIGGVCVYDSQEKLYLLSANGWPWYYEIEGSRAFGPLYFLSAWLTRTSRPWITCDEEDNLYVVFSAYRNGYESEIFIRRKEPGLFWSQLAQVSDSDQQKSYYPVVSASGGQIQIVWMDKRDGKFEVYWKEFNGSNWTPDVRLSQKEDNLFDKHPRVICLGEKIVVVWYNQQGQILWREKTKTRSLPKEKQEKKLGLSYPNPFNPECYIPVERMKNKAGEMKIKIYNILGQLVREIECSTGQEGKGLRVYWDGRDSRGLEVPAGVYFYEVAGENVRRMVVLR